MMYGFVHPRITETRDADGNLQLNINTNTPLEKYYQNEWEQYKDYHDIKFIFSAAYNLPVIDRGKTGLYKNHTIWNYFHAKIFDLSNEEDNLRYHWVLDRVANGWFVLLKKEHYWDEQKKNMYVFLEWVQRYVYIQFSEQ